MRTMVRVVSRCIHSHAGDVALSVTLSTVSLFLTSPHTQAVAVFASSTVKSYLLMKKKGNAAVKFRGIPVATLYVFHRNSHGGQNLLAVCTFRR